MYSVPEKYYFRIHHARPRFKNDAESVLLFVCRNISGMSPCSAEEFGDQLFNLIRLYPGNALKARKTINNWRTEISALFGLIQKSGDTRFPGTYAQVLAKNEDLIEFFRYFLLTFQYPGGHLKPKSVNEQIQKGVKFHPTKFLIELFWEGQKLLGDEKVFSVSSAEITHCVFNDLRATSGSGFTPKNCAELILRNRKSKVDYDETGDVIRYAQDVLDYMVLADVADKNPTNARYTLNHLAAPETLDVYNRSVLFDGYSHLYGKQNLPASDAAEIEDEWFAFVNFDRTDTGFVQDIREMLQNVLDAPSSDAEVSTNGVSVADGTSIKSLFASQDIEVTEEISILLDGFRRALEGTTGDIGRFGESLTMSHERFRLIRAGRSDLVGGVKKIPDHLGVGYDILSSEGVEPFGQTDKNRCIEVKTTRSRGKLKANSFTLTPNEWTSARSIGDHYYVYRIAISKDDVTLFIIRNPYQREVEGKLKMIPRNGAIITYDESAGYWEVIPLLKNIQTNA